MLLCTDCGSAGAAVRVVKAAPAPPPAPGRLPAARSVYERLQPAPLTPKSLSPPAFESVVARVAAEEAACTFRPRINHTHDEKLRAWCANSTVFARLYGNAECRLEAQRAREQAAETEAAEREEALRRHFRSLRFPERLYSRETPSPKVGSADDNAAHSSTALAHSRAARHFCSADAPSLLTERVFEPHTRKSLPICSPLCCQRESRGDGAGASLSGRDANATRRERRRRSSLPLSAANRRVVEMQIERMRAARRAKCEGDNT